jgi:hypothetical protein
MIPEGYNGPLKLDMFGVDDVDRVLGLADSFLEHWESDEGIDAKERAEVAERRAEWEVLRPALCELPTLIAALRRAHAALDFTQPQLAEYVRWHHEFDGGCSVEMEEALQLTTAARGTTYEALRTAGVEP